jgi:hypothetical protein
MAVFLHARLDDEQQLWDKFARTHVGRWFVLTL